LWKPAPLRRGVAHRVYDELVLDVIWSWAAGMPGNTTGDQSFHAALFRRPIVH